MSYQFSTITSLSDDTYLESFVESISASLPNEMRRNLEHLRDLDDASFRLMEGWRDRQDGCLKGVEETLVKVLRGEAATAVAATVAAGDGVGKDSFDEAGDAAAVESPAGGTKRKLPETSPEKAACVKSRARKVKFDGKKKFRSDPAAADGSNGGDEGVSESKNGDTKCHDSNSKPGTANEIDGRQSQFSEFFQKQGPPTNEDIKHSLLAHYPQYTSQREEINKIYRRLQQFSREKIDTANQIKLLVDMALSRLDRDIEKFEVELGIDSHVGAATTSGANSTGGGIGTIAGGLGVVGHHANVASEGAIAGAGAHRAGGNNSTTVSVAPPATTAPTPATASNPDGNFRRSSSTTLPMLPPHPASAMQQQHYLSTRGAVPPSPKSVQTSNLAAIQVTPNSPDWILAKILSHDKSAKMYALSDEDLQSSQIYKIPERQVVVLRGTERNKWNRGDSVYAVYPDTTSFYHATVSTPPLNGFVMVQFKDDWDANGVTHEKAVLMGHVMKVPPGRK